MNETSKILESGIQSTHFLSIKRASPTTLSQLPSPTYHGSDWPVSSPLFIPPTFRTHSFLPWRWQKNVTQTQWPQSTRQYFKYFGFTRLGGRGGYKLHKLT